MYKNIFIVIVLVVAVLWLINFFHEDEMYNLHLEQLKQEYALQPVSSVDHSKLPALKKEFKTPQEVTAACISCHTERHKEIIASTHWNWERVAYIEGRGISVVGKKNVLNNFCIGSNANEQSCARCHIGFGMTNDQFDFNNANNVDCMVCHDNSEEYLKGNAMAGYPDRTVNLKNVAQHVGAPTKDDCGACHFYGGGGNNVKHGDLEYALLACDKNIDVHMAANGMNMSCISCHTAENHVMKGRLYSVSSENTNRAYCEDCHTNTPHFDDLLNRHTAKVACQTCHIPVYAKVNSTKMSWQWSEAGKLHDGKPYTEENEYGDHTYMSIKGKFEWAKNVIPDYIWFNGTADHYILGDTIKSKPVAMNTLNGSFDDKYSKIIPVKIHRGDQIFDLQTKMLIQPKLYAPQPGDSAFWEDFDWELAAKAGMERVGLPFSGDYDFIETVMFWPINHMVSPKEQSVGCAECHTRDEGRLVKLTGFYMPGRDRIWQIDLLGNLIVIMSVLTVVGHGIIRLIVKSKRQKLNIH
ncbi:MAG: tetrathionate reductase family octaheme c-type cytochrome [Candidatus Marinimicrobia bacterium]|nr:tetrathionate reductase family octaheme c-type cytochrome [Candidatus Neomarinimicrobiota bacterium]